MTSPRAATATQSKSLWKLGGLTLSQLGRGVFNEIIANDVFGQAAELAFYFLFALFPLILIMLTLFGLFASHSVELQNDLLSYFADFFPPAAFQVLRTVASELGMHSSGGKLTFGIVTALWGVSGGVSSMISALNLAYHVREDRSWFKVRAIALGLSLLISILLLTGSFAGLLGSHFVRWFGTGLPSDPVVVLAWKAIQWAAAILFVTMSCALVYHFGANLQQRRRWHWVTPGAAFGAFVWLGASFGFRMYLHFFNNYSATYGSLGAVMILLAWLYVTGLAYLIGGEINAEIERAERRESSEQNPQ